MLAKTILTRGDEPEVEPVVACTAERGCPHPSVREILKPQSRQAGLKPEVIRYCAWHLEMYEHPQLFATRDGDGNLYISACSAGVSPALSMPGARPGATGGNGRQPHALASLRCQDCGAELKSNGMHRCRDCWKRHVRAQAQARAKPVRLFPGCGHPMPRGSNGRYCWDCYVAQQHATKRARRALGRRLPACQRRGRQTADLVRSRWEALLRSV